MHFKKKGRVILLVSLCVVLLVLVLSLNVSVAGEPGMAGGCVSISFDKWDMLRADRVIIETRGETYTVTDPAFVRSFSRETLAGTYKDYCCAQMEDGWMEIYRGNRLLRRMRYISNHNALAYEADAAHWVLFGKEGHAFLSEDMCKKLEEIIGI